MGMWVEWRGPRREWSRRTKIVAFAAGCALALAWGIAVQYLLDR